MHQDAQGKKILEDAAKTVNSKQPVVFVAANDEDYGSYRDFYRNAPASLR
jgi:phosphonate transport system substrate-binding protein